MPVRPHFALFDGLRGLAVISVVTFHVASLTDALGRGVTGRTASVLGAQAVIVFFVISGFLLYRPFVAARAEGRPPPSLRRYARRRAGRILPAYWVALTVLAIFPGIVGVFEGSFWRYYGFAQLYSQETLGLGIPVAWTLCVEVTFYLLLPLWAFMARRWRLRGDLVALGVVMAAAAVLQILAARKDVPRLWADALPGQMVWLGLGMALAVWSVARHERPPALVVRGPVACWAVAVAALAGLAALVPDGGLAGLVTALSVAQDYPAAIAKVVLSAVMAIAVVLPAVFGEDEGGLPRRILTWRPVAYLGVISYSLYLYHLTIAQLLALDSDPYHFSAGGLGLAAKIGNGSTPVLLVLTVLVTVPIAAASHRFIERPFYRR